METWERLRYAREAKGLTQSAIAERLNMSQQRYHRYEHGREMKSSLILQICAVLECSPNWLLGYSEQGQQLPPDSLLLRQLRDAFDQLNDTGKQEAVKRVQEMTQIPAYAGEGSGCKSRGGAEIPAEAM